MWIVIARIPEDMDYLLAWQHKSYLCYRFRFLKTYSSNIFHFVADCSGCFDDFIRIDEGEVIILDNVSSRREVGPEDRARICRLED